MPELVNLPEKNLESVFNIVLLKNKHRLVKQLKQCYEPNVHGDKTWASSYLIMDYLQTHKLIKSNSHVLELGCGWGAASIYCAKNGAKSVTGLDIDNNVFPYLEVQAEINGVEIKTTNRSYEKITGKQLNEYNLLIGADICFWDKLIPVLKKLIKRSLNNGVKRMLIADPGRSPFFELAESISDFATVDLKEWYVCDPKYYEGYILDIRPK